MANSVALSLPVAVPAAGLSVHRAMEIPSNTLRIEYVLLHYLFVCAECSAFDECSVKQIVNELICEPRIEIQRRVEAAIAQGADPKTAEALYPSHADPKTAEEFYTSHGGIDPLHSKWYRDSHLLA